MIRVESNEAEDLPLCSLPVTLVWEAKFQTQKTGKAVAVMYSEQFCM
jgi:hypothetical protein